MLCLDSSLYQVWFQSVSFCNYYKNFIPTGWHVFFLICWTRGVCFAETQKLFLSVFIHEHRYCLFVCALSFTMGALVIMFSMIISIISNLFGAETLQKVADVAMVERNQAISSTFYKTKKHQIWSKNSERNSAIATKQCDCCLILLITFSQLC